MLGKILLSVSRTLRSDFRRKLRGNSSYKKLGWNLPERLQVYCSTHYMVAMLFLWCIAAGAVLLVEYLRPVLLPFASEHLKGIKKLTEWTTSLLGSQVTLIGIVFPLVVGLISVLFQKKSSRIHIQSAYQLNSGYMFSGLSGLSLVAFILVGGLFSSLDDIYLNTAFAVVAFIWMIFNIFQAIWFFIISLNVLDDKKRDRLMLKYFQSQILSGFLQDSMVTSWMRYPGANIRDVNIKDVEIASFYHPSDNKSLYLIKRRLKDNEEITDIYLRPLFFLLRRLKPSEQKAAKVFILPGIDYNKNEVCVLATSDLHYSRLWVWMTRICFRKGPRKSYTVYKNITRDFYGETYDALNDRNLNTFENATDRLINTYTTLKKSFRYESGNYIDECSMISSYATFSELFHFTFNDLIRETAKTVDTSSEYYRIIMDVPSSIYHASDVTELSDFKQCIQSLFGIWRTLTALKAGSDVNLSVSQEQRHRELISHFIGKWENWFMWLHLDNNSETDSVNYANRLLHHLGYSPQLIVTAMVADDTYAADNATDILNLWFNHTRFEPHWEAEYSWHSFFLTPAFLNFSPAEPDWLSVLRGKPYAEDAAQALMFLNAVADIRLLTAGYIIAFIGQMKNIVVQDVVRHLLKSEVVYPTGAIDNMTVKFDTPTDIIDSMIRIEYQAGSMEGRWYTFLSGIIKKLTSLNEGRQITGRIYMGRHLDIRNLYNSYVDIAIMLATEVLPVSRRVSEALVDNLFSSYNKFQIIHRLKELKRDPSTGCPEYLMTQEQYKERVSVFNDTLENYIQAFSQSRAADIIASEIDIERLRKTDLRLTEQFYRELSSDMLLSLFKCSQSNNLASPWEMRAVAYNTSKELVALNVNDKIYSDFTQFADIRRNIIIKFHSLINQLPVTFKKEVNNIVSLLQEVRELTSDEQNYTLIFYGTRFVEALRNLSYQNDRHAELGITADRSPGKAGRMPIRINNCNIYQIWGSLDHYSLLVRNSTFGELRLFRYPDGTLFNTYWQENIENSADGAVITLWEQEMEVTGAVVARLNHVV